MLCNSAGERPKFAAQVLTISGKPAGRSCWRGCRTRTWRQFLPAFDHPTQRSTTNHPYRQWRTRVLPRLAGNRNLRTLSIRTAGLFELYHSRLDPAGPRDGACVRAACKLRPAEPIFEKMFRSDPVSYLVRRCVQIQLQVAVPDFRRSQSYPVSRSSTKLSPEHD